MNKKKKDNFIKYFPFIPVTHFWYYIHNWLDDIIFLGKLNIIILLHCLKLEKQQTKYNRNNDRICVYYKKKESSFSFSDAKIFIQSYAELHFYSFTNQKKEQKNTQKLHNFLCPSNFFQQLRYHQTCISFTETNWLKIFIKMTWKLQSCF